MVKRVLGREVRARDESLPYGLREREIVGRPALRPPRVYMGVGMNFSHYNKRGEAGLSSTYLYGLLFMVHPVVFLIGRLAGQVHAELL